MTENTDDKLKETIIRELVKSREAINRDVIDSVRELKNVVMIEEGTGRVIILNRDAFKNKDRIVGLMLGKYAAFMAGIVNSPEVDINLISHELGIVDTTLSAP